MLQHHIKHLNFEYRVSHKTAVTATERSATRLQHLPRKCNNVHIAFYMLKHDWCHFLCHKACWTANKAITGSRSMFTVDAKPTWTCDIAGLPSEMSYTRQLHLSLHLLLKTVTFAITSVNFFNNKIQMMKPASSVSPQNFQLMTSTLTSLTCQSCSVTSVHLLLVKY